MKEFSFSHYVILITVCLIMAVTGLYLLANFRTRFRGIIRIEWLRQNIVAWLIIFCFFIATAPMNLYFFQTLRDKGILHTIEGEMIAAAINTISVFNIVRTVPLNRWVKKLSFIKQRAIILFTLIITCVLFNVPLNY